MSITNITISISLSTNGFQLILPLTDFSGSINWGDSDIETFTETHNPSHTYVNNGTYTISLLNVTNLTHYGNAFSNIKTVVTQFSYLVKIDSLIDLSNAFYSYSNLSNVIFNTDVTDNVTNMENMFYECIILNCNIELNCMSCIKLNGLLCFANNFNSSVLLSNTGNVTDMSMMFYYATSFNQPINLDCSSCNTLYLFLANCYYFNSSVTLTNTNNVTNMSFMFYSATIFNQPINLNCSSCTTLYFFLNSASSFNNSLNLTPIPLLDNVNNMLDYTSLLPGNYSNLLILWGNQTVQPLVTFESPDIYYNVSAESSLDNLRNQPNNWTITNAGIAPSPTVISAEPLTAPSGTNVTVLIHGTHFGYNLVIKVDDLFPSFQFSYEQIQLHMPSTILPGESVITIETNYGICTIPFTYTENYAPIITSIDPSTGTFGTTVNVFGQNFNHITYVRIEDDEYYTNIEYSIINDQQITLILPQINEGTYQIKLANMYEFFATTQLTYTDYSTIFISDEQNLQTFFSSEHITYGKIVDNVMLTQNVITQSSNALKHLTSSEFNYKIYKA